MSEHLMPKTYYEDRTPSLPLQPKHRFRAPEGLWDLRFRRTQIWEFPKIRGTLFWGSL